MISVNSTLAANMHHTSIQLDFDAVLGIAVALSLL